MIKEKKIDFQKIKDIIEKRGNVFNEETVYILPEYSDNTDILNEYTPDIYKILKKHKIDVVVVKKNQHAYQALRDETIILPLILGIPFSILSSLIYDWIKKSFSPSRLKIRVVTKDATGNYKEIQIEGTPNEVKESLIELEKKYE